MGVVAAWPGRGQSRAGRVPSVPLGTARRRACAAAPRSPGSGRAGRAAPARMPRWRRGIRGVRGFCFPGLSWVQRGGLGLQALHSGPVVRPWAQLMAAQSVVQALVRGAQTPAIRLGLCQQGESGRSLGAWHPPLHVRHPSCAGHGDIWHPLTICLGFARKQKKGHGVPCLCDDGEGSLQAGGGPGDRDSVPCLPACFPCPTPPMPAFPVPGP